MSSVSPTTAALGAPPPSERAQLKQAAQAFEAILVKQMLTSARAAQGEGGLFSSQGLQTFNAMQDERFAQITAQSGSIGFAKMIEAQMAKRLTPLPPAGGAGGGPVGEPPVTGPPLTPPAIGRGTYLALPFNGGT